MALKLFCSKCHELIKEVTPDEASRLNDEVICKKCEEYVYQMRDQFDKLSKRELSKITSAINQGMVKIEDLMRKVLD